MEKLVVTLGIIALIFVLAVSNNQTKLTLFYPEPTNHVVDSADVISDEVETQLNNKLAEAPTEVAVVTVKTTQPLDEASYAIELANKWGIGDKDKDDGILFLIVTEDRKLRIEVGSGAEAFMNDAKAGRILNTYVVPELKNNNWEKGIINGTDAILKEVK